jgi:hypothetical protein
LKTVQLVTVPAAPTEARPDSAPLKTVQLVTVPAAPREGAGR